MAIAQPNALEAAAATIITNEKKISTLEQEIGGLKERKANAIRDLSGQRGIYMDDADGVLSIVALIESKYTDCQNLQNQIIAAQDKIKLALTKMGVAKLGFRQVGVEWWFSLNNDGVLIKERN